MKKSRVTVSLLRTAFRGLKGDVPVRIKIAQQSCDEYWPITGLQATKDCIILVVDGTNIDESDIEIC